MHTFLIGHQSVVENNRPSKFYRCRSIMFICIIILVLTVNIVTLFLLLKYVILLRKTPETTNFTTTPLITTSTITIQHSGWVLTGSMNVARSQHTASLLTNGKVLVTGGLNNGSITSAELYDPSIGIWTTTASMNAARSKHTSSVLLNGKVLVTGGFNNGALNSAELYDLSSGTWTATGNMNYARFQHTASVLPNRKVLVTGGLSNGTLNSAELFDPLTKTWRITANMNSARFHHTASVLTNGKVLIAGGQNGNAILSTAELYDPFPETWATTGSMSYPAVGHTASLLTNGNVFVTISSCNGGFLVYEATAQLYDPSTETWIITDNMTTLRREHTASVLPSGKVLVTGGVSIVPLNSAELYDPLAGTRMNDSSRWPFAKTWHTASVLANGQVLTAGGSRNRGVCDDSSSQLYDPLTGSWRNTAHRE